MNRRERDQLLEFYEERRQGLFTYALTITRDRFAAEDAIQSTFQRLLNSKRLPRDLTPYVYRCVRNAATDAWRREKRERDSLFDMSRLEERPDSIPVYRELDSVMDQLGPDERETIALKIWDGMTFRDIAELRGVSINTVASWYRRGLQKMKERLESEAIVDEGS